MATTATTATPRRDSVSIDDLLTAIDWMTEGYEGDDENTPKLERVAQMLRDEIEARQIRSIQRQVAAKQGRKPTAGQVRATLAKIRENQ